MADLRELFRTLAYALAGGALLAVLLLGGYCLATDARPSEVARFLAVASTRVAVPSLSGLDLPTAAALHSQTVEPHE